MDASRARYGLVLAPTKQAGGITEDRVMLVASAGFTQLAPVHGGWPVWSCVVLRADVLLPSYLDEKITLGPGNGWTEVEE